MACNGKERSLTSSPADMATVCCNHAQSGGGSELASLSPESNPAARESMAVAHAATDTSIDPDESASGTLGLMADSKTEQKRTTALLVHPICAASLRPIGTGWLKLVPAGILSSLIDSEAPPHATTSRRNPCKSSGGDEHSADSNIATRVGSHSPSRSSGWDLIPSPYFGSGLDFSFDGTRIESLSDRVPRALILSQVKKGTNSAISIGFFCTVLVASVAVSLAT